ncbi:hypothetical protein DPEC_G00294800 [Dallia pectoralis]|uniref:Uncharacterized protein n=1 Tax=Dallia pectoralis TaxID=75939 RepID=A0ACC2FIT4_DALPE|nr:hypothetical protein DPEC_G00294800 [Dallia pectoralis]
MKRKAKQSSLFAFILSKKRSEEQETPAILSNSVTNEELPILLGRPLHIKSSRSHPLTPASKEPRRAAPPPQCEVPACPLLPTPPTMAATTPAAAKPPTMAAAQDCFRPSNAQKGLD